MYSNKESGILFMNLLITRLKGPDSTAFIA